MSSKKCSDFIELEIVTMNKVDTHSSIVVNDRIGLRHFGA